MLFVLGISYLNYVMYINLNSFILFVSSNKNSIDYDDKFANTTTEMLIRLTVLVAMTVITNIINFILFGVTFIIPLMIDNSAISEFAHPINLMATIDNTMNIICIFLSFNFYTNITIVLFLAKYLTKVYQNKSKTIENMTLEIQMESSTK